MWGHEGYGFGFGGGFMWIIWILLMVVVVWLVKAAIGGDSNRPVGGGGASPSALEILKQRYARGEINQAEYERMRKQLMQ